MTTYELPDGRIISIFRRALGADVIDLEARTVTELRQEHITLPPETTYNPDSE